MRLTPFCLALLTVAPAVSQVTTATFYGSVTDSSGARIPNAIVNFIHDATGSVSTRPVDSTGEFTFDFLRVGLYSILIEAHGF